MYALGDFFSLFFKKIAFITWFIVVFCIVMTAGGGQKQLCPLDKGIFGVIYLHRQ